MKNIRFTPAFSMIELIFVIIILGIVSSIGSEMIAKVYESYIFQRAEHSAALKTELAATQIANRLTSAIPGTVYRVTTTAFEPIEANLGFNENDYIGLQWVGFDAESFNAAATPGWSGFCDINASTTPNLETPGSALTLTTTIKNNLSSTTPLAVYFPDDARDYNASFNDVDTLTLNAPLPTTIREHYKLAWSSYAVVVENGDLYLYYNFPPTPRAARGATRSLLMRNVVTFKFQGSGNTIRFKICKNEAISADVNITACKEKAVF